MKVISAKNMAALEKKAFERGASDDILMQRAALGVANILSFYVDSHNLEKKVTLLAGKGNNAADGFCAALFLLEEGFEVDAYQIAPLHECSPLCQKYGNAFKEQGGKIYFIQSAHEILLPESGVLLDGILGTGFKGKVSDPLIQIFDKINDSSVPIFSIDIPSGVCGDTGIVEDSAVVADYTLFLALPKKGFFFHQGWDHVGKLIYVDLGLDQKLIDETVAELEIVTIEDCHPLLPPVKRTRHKYQAGYVAGFCGSKGMMGAAALSGMGALRAGAGIVKIISLQEEAQNFLYYPELIHKNFGFNERSQILEYIAKANAIYLGPGIGQEKETEQFICWLLQHIDKPCVIDADGLNIMAKYSIKPPKEAILTPHHGEAVRLLNLSKDSSLEALLQACQAYVNLHEVVLILKGGPTFIFAKHHIPFVCAVGDPGMATAGTGDVLTGVLTGLLAQEYTGSYNVAKLGTYLHGKAGELAAEKKTSYAMIATDLLKMIYHAWNYLLNPDASEL